MAGKVSADPAHRLREDRPSVVEAARLTCRNPTGRTNGRRRTLDTRHALHLRLLSRSFGSRNRLRCPRLPWTRPVPRYHAVPVPSVIGLVSPHLVALLTETTALRDHVRMIRAEDRLHVRPDVRAARKAPVAGSADSTAEDALLGMIRAESRPLCARLRAFRRATCLLRRPIHPESV
jgi:hypothetical protein